MNKHRKHQHLINEAIRVPQVFLLDPTKQPLGLKPIREAQNLARLQGVDLILIAPKANPPVCLIGDYGKFLYQQEKHEHKTKAPKLKEVQLSANIFEHDLDIKAAHAREFLATGHVVKTICKLHGREKAHPEIGRHQVELFITKTGKSLQDCKIQANGGTFIVYLNP